MSSKKRLLEKSRLYVIVDKKTLGSRPVLNTVNKIFDRGADIIQLRDKISKKENILKEAYTLSKLLSKTKTLFIINDYIDIAKIVNSDGIHLGQGDCSVEIARRLLGKDKIIGISCHNLNQAKNAQGKGADYVSIGPIFSTPTKPEYKAIGTRLIQRIKKNIRIPFFVIGGINKNNINEVLAWQVKGVAVSRAVCRANNVNRATEILKKILERSA